MNITASKTIKCNLPKHSSMVQSTCAYCGVGCGVDITLEQGEPVNLQGTPEHPANYGRLCVKGTNLLNTVDLTNRLLTPQVNDQDCTWSTAINHASDGLKQVIKQYGPDAVAFYVSGQLLTEDYYVANKLMKGYIGSGNIDTNSRLCMSSAVAAYKRSFGEDVVPCDYKDLEQTDVLVLIGSNAAWTHPVLFQRIERAKQLNPKFTLVVIDPRKTATAQSADIFLPIKPGSDAALYNGLLCYLNSHQAVDKDYIAAHTEGFDQALSQANQWPIDKVARFCGLSSKQVSNFYAVFATAEKVLTMYSMGINQSTSGVDKCQTIINAHLATGKIGKPGCGPFSITGQPNAMGGREVGGLANQLAAHLDINNKAHQALVQQFWQSPTIANKEGLQAIDMFEAIEKGQIKAVWIMATNPLVSMPNTARVRAALEKCELVIVSDCVQNNDTLALADVKFPATPWLEKNGTVTNSERCISRQRPAIMPSGQAKHDWQIISLVAQSMGYDGFNYQRPQQIFVEFARLSGYKNSENKMARLFDISALSELDTSDYDQLSPQQWPIDNKGKSKQRIFQNGHFFTLSKRAQFHPVTPKLAQQKISAAYPIVLNSGRIRDQWHSMTRTSKATNLNEHTTKPYLSMSQFDANTRNIRTDDLVTVKSSIGEVIVPAFIDNTLAKGQSFLPIHWSRQFASNAVVSSLYNGCVDPLSGQPEMKHVGVAVNKNHYAQYIEIYCSNEHLFDNQLLNANFQYWLSNNQEKSQYIQLATTDKALNILAILQTITGIKGEWLSVKNHLGQVNQIVCVNNKRLALLASAQHQPFSQARSWIKALFNSTSLTFEELQSLLNNQPTKTTVDSRKVCSCFNVYEIDIVEAIGEGANSIDSLGKRLKCGTNCGSCKAELRSLIVQVNDKNRLSA